MPIVLVMNTVQHASAHFAARERNETASLYMSEFLFLFSIPTNKLNPSAIVVHKCCSALVSRAFPPGEINKRSFAGLRASIRIKVVAAKLIFGAHWRTYHT